MSSEANTSLNYSFDAPPSPLAPRPDNAVPRKRVVPKKSKLSMLGVGNPREKEKEKGRDFSDVVRRVGGDTSSARGGYEIYVDPTVDPDLGEILMVKKKKSRGALGTLGWGGPMADVSNIPKAKPEEKKEKETKDKWWTIGRGRKDSKEKTEKAKESRPFMPPRSKTPEPFRPPPPEDSRARFNSLDSGALLSVPFQRNNSSSPALNEPPRSSTPEPARSFTPTFVPSNPTQTQGSVAIRAMRSVRSMARLGSWNPKPEDVPKVPKRSSTSSFEVGTLPVSPAPTNVQKKKSILGLGLPSSIRLPTVRGGSTASSTVVQATIDNNRLSVESAAMMGRPRSGSAMSTGSSLRPMSTSSGTSRASSSSCTSVKWDEEGLETVREQRYKERETKAKVHEEQKRRTSKESRHSVEGRRRTPLSDVFPDVEAMDGDEPDDAIPIIAVESATSDGHSTVSTPVRRARPRPVSEQMLGRSRPQGFHEDAGQVSLSTGVISILDAATHDLAQLINILDLEATPLSPDRSPLQPGYHPGYRLQAQHQGSPLRARTLRANLSSITSLRPYAHARAAGQSLPPQALIGQRITSFEDLSTSPPRAPSVKTPPVGSPAFTLKHKRTLTPGPAPDPSPVLRALRPARSRPMSNLKPPGPPPDSPTPSPRRSSALTFSSIRVVSAGPMAVDELSTNPLFMAAKKRLSPEKRTPYNPTEDDTTSRRPLAPGAKKMLGMKGTMGGSDVSAYRDESIDHSDPDSDIPGELQVILDDNRRRSLDDTVDFDDFPRDVSAPPSPLPPVFRAQVIDEQDNHADVDDDDEGVNISDEDNTKKSFDFTGEIQKLNESGGSDRHSFMEQLENAFKTPAKVDLRYDFGGDLLGVPPVPALPRTNLPADTTQSDEGSDPSPVKAFSNMVEYPSDDLIMDVEVPTFLRSESSEGPRDLKLQKSFDMFTTAQLRDLVEPSLRPISGDFDDEEVSGAISRSTSSGAFRFGGASRSPKSVVDSYAEKPLTLSDIIPSPAHARSLSMGEDDSVLKSILAKASDVARPAPRPRLDSDSSSKRRVRDDSNTSDPYRHSTASSIASFVGLDSFDEVRRGFEFHDHRPAFYPPQSASAVPRHLRNESVFSIASISSYGHVVNPGVPDPFDYGEYGLPSLQERPSSEDLSISMSMNVEDTFEFHARARKHKKVASDASSFYFRSHRRNDSNVSAHFPPVSRYNRSFGIHSRNDSSTSMNSIAHSYANGRAAWARHQPEASVDSVASDFSVMRLGRPGVGDKMFNTGVDLRPLTSISASPQESYLESRYEHRTSYESDSIMDEFRSSGDDSLFDRTGARSSASEESIFGYNGYNGYNGGHLAPLVYRPLSVLSFNDRSLHSPREDDTMISMLGGGRERRESIGSLIDKSPKHSELQNGQARKAQIIAKPSIASTVDSVKFGDERMIRAQHGHLDRRSLEESCLVADGEDLSFSFAVNPVFTRPGIANRSRSSTCTSSSGVDTPPLSSSDGYSSFSDGSQSSIDLSHINARTRPRARGSGHRRRFSQARASRTSAYATIEEEMSSPEKSSPESRKSSPTTSQPIFIVDEDTASIHSATTTWDDERGIVALRRYYDLRDEAEHTVSESKRMWLDTPFSVFALQTFDPPKHPSGMQAMLEHSVQNYGPLPSELRPRRIRSRTSSRASPYPSTRSLKVSASPELVTKIQTEMYRNATSSPLRELPVNSNMASVASPFNPSKAFGAPPEAESKGLRDAFGLPARPRVGSTARRTALGWSKRSSGKASSDMKENQATPKLNTTPGESLRISRPRPKGRPTPARPLRV
ncbi:hypothetical protein BDZ89DRAFT_1087946 [Hymenopellis radicata]|nr:hypothetical protein BDZ89DRAFT_1087946 [Hymenopellis radicata]